MSDPRLELGVLRAENARLRDRVEDLERELFATHVSLPLEWRLSASEARVMRVLVARQQAGRSAIMAALYSARPDDPPGIKIIEVFIHQIRKKVRPFGVEIWAVREEGYRLDEATRRKLRSLAPLRTSSPSISVASGRGATAQ
jgi:DNA-binding response OmpR family regulator